MINFNNDGAPEKIEGFTVTCDKCNFPAEISYSFKHWGGMTGYDMSLSVHCPKCDTREPLI